MNVKPIEYPQLGKRLETLHPLMFGSRRLCKGISDALGKEAKQIIATHAKDFAVIRLARTCDQDAAKKLAADWLIADDNEVT